MALGKKTIKIIEHKFYNYEKIKKAVAEARAEQGSKGGITGGNNGHSRVSDPTSATAIRHAMPIACVTIQDGLYDTKIYNPEKWIKIIDYTFKIYGNRLEAVLAKRKYLKKEDVDFIVDSMLISKTTYYSWRLDFVTQAAFLAVAENLVDVNEITL